MRLIDADLLKKNCKITGSFDDNFVGVSLATLCEVIDNQPTAYDVDKVVEELEEQKVQYGKLQLAHNDANMVCVYVGKEQAIDCAIEVVKAGVANE